MEDPKLPASYFEYSAAPAVAAHIWKQNPKMTAGAATAGFLTRYYVGKNYNNKMERNKWQLLNQDPEKMEKLSELGFHKTAFSGPAVDISMFGLPSAAGYVIGRGQGRAMYDDKEKMDRFGVEGLLGIGFIPGATGYIIGKRHGYAAAKNENGGRRR